MSRWPIVARARVAGQARVGAGPGPWRVLDSAAMDHYRLRIAQSPAPDDVALAPGMHGIGRDSDRLALVEAAGAPVRFCVDRRGVWLAVDAGVRGIHVNGREIQRMAMLRVGDAIYVDGIEMRLVSAHPVQVPGDDAVAANVPVDEDDPRVVLRGVGGRFHGRSFTLHRPRLVGAHADADIRIDEPAFADRHARLELWNGRVVLRDLGSAEGSLVNGEVVRDALLDPGDQVVFDAHHRFVVEAPVRAAPGVVDDDADEDDDTRELPLHATPGPRFRVPWLLLAALMIAGLLSLLLLFGRA